MKYVSFIGTEGAMPEEALEIMNREWPAFEAEMAPRGVRVFGRELDFPSTAATVRVREGKALVSDGPFIETKEFVAGLEMLECVDLAEAIEVTTRNPVVRFNPFEIRPVRGEPILSDRVPAFAQNDDSAGTPFLLIVWVTASVTTRPDPAEMDRGHQAWSRELERRGSLIVGSMLDAPQTATMLRYSDGEIHVSGGPIVSGEGFITGVDVVSCADRDRAIELAATHPLAAHHAIEVRPFYTGQDAPA